MKRATWLRRAGAGLRLELRPLLKLAVPVVAAEVSWMTMGIVDTMMVGRVSAEAIGAVSLGGAIFFSVAIFGLGLNLGLDYTVAHAVGAGRLDEAHQWLIQALYLTLAIAMPSFGLLRLAIATLPWWGLEPGVTREAMPYLSAVSFSLLPLFLQAALRRYLQALTLVNAIMLVAVSANVVNVAANWVLIFGHLGFPAMGAEGAGWATCLARVYMMVGLLGFALYHDRRHDTGLSTASLRLEISRIRRLVRLGLPAALQTTLEIGVFSAATLLAGKLAAVALAAHQIALNVAGFTFMVPLGVSSAAAVRVGLAVGRRDASAAGRAGWTALLVGAGFMGVAGLAFVTWPHAVLRAFTSETEVVAMGVSLLAIAAVFQLFDGVQVVATGALRGSGDTRTPMFINLLGHWALGLPVGYALCFVWQWGVVGLWSGLCLGLIAVAVTLLLVWTRRVRTLRAEISLPAPAPAAVRAAG
jgi:MATE family multidrug resistance protein